MGVAAAAARGGHRGPVTRPRRRHRERARARQPQPIGRRQTPRTVENNRNGNFSEGFSTEHQRRAPRKARPPPAACLRPACLLGGPAAGPATAQPPSHWEPFDVINAVLRGGGGSKQEISDASSRRFFFFFPEQPSRRFGFGVRLGRARSGPSRTHERRRGLRG